MPTTPAPVPAARAIADRELATDPEGVWTLVRTYNGATVEGPLRLLRPLMTSYDADGVAYVLRSPAEPHALLGWSS